MPSRSTPKYTRVAISAAARGVSAGVGCREYAMTVASRLYFSNFYRGIYFLTVLASLLCVVWTGLNHWKIPSSTLFISLEIAVSTLLVLEVVLRMAAFRRRFWSRWCNIFDFVAVLMSVVSVAMYFNEQGVLGELEAVATDSLLALRNALQYARLGIFLKNRSALRRTARGGDIDFQHLDTAEDSDEDWDQELALSTEGDEVERREDTTNCGGLVHDQNLESYDEVPLMAGVERS